MSSPLLARPDGRRPRRDAQVVGRTDERAQIVAAFASGERLITIVGPPGIGKTTLAAVHLAHDAGRDGAPEAIALCELSHARSREDAFAAIGAVLGVGTTGDVVASVVRSLAARGSATLVLDNFEQLADLAPEIASVLLAEVPELCLLITSQEPLRIAGEVRLPIAPLAVPNADDPPEKVLASEAVSLFIARARAVQPAFAPNAAHAADVGAIARLLDGVPLAIELCAARLATFDLRAIHDRLTRAAPSWTLLDRAQRGEGSRKTLRGAIAWSWSLLDERHQRALAWLGAFRGPFSLELASAVLDESAVEPVVEHLAERSLLRVVGPGRYAMLQAIRAFAEEQLAESGERTRAMQRHAAVILERAEPLLPALSTPATNEARAALAALHDDLLAIHARALDGELPNDVAVRAAIAMQPELHMRGSAMARAQIAEASIALAPDDSAERAWLELHLALSLMMMGRTTASRDHFIEAARVAQRAGARDVELRAHLRRAECEALLGDPAKDLASIEDAEAIAGGESEQRLWMRACVAAARGRYSWTHGAQADSRAHFLAAAELFERAGDITQATHKRCAVGLHLLASAQHEAALPHLFRARDEYQRLGFRREHAKVTGDLALAIFELGRIDEARALFRESLAGSRRMGHSRALAWHLCYAGVLEVVAGDVRAAHDLFDEGARIWRELGEFARIALQIAAFAGSVVAQAALVGSAATGTLACFDGLRAADEELARAEHLLRDDPRGAARCLAEARTRIANERAVSGERPAAVVTELRLATRVLDVRADAIEAALSTAALRSLTVAGDGSWFARATGPRVDLSRMVAPRRILTALVAAHARTPGQPAALDELFAAGWPEQRALPTAAANRVHVALNKLRTLGLRDAIVSRDGGWLLDPALAVLKCA